MAIDYGTLIGALFGSAASVYNNKSNIDLQKETNKANLLAQQEANALQIDLANTSHQREVVDLKAAGLNPILSAGGSGASTPSIGTATQIAGNSDSIAEQMNELGRAASSAADADRRLKYQQIENLQSQDENLKSQNFNLEQDGKLKSAQAKVAELDAKIAETKLRGIALAESAVNSARKRSEDMNAIKEISPLPKPKLDPNLAASLRKLDDPAFRMEKKLEMARETGVKPSTISDNQVRKWWLEKAKRIFKK
ncbi:minor capsid protein [Capybara microvirus Cap1_SP_160]|nr:minor capsid protein [Capybara microvirus Cap1_SP_160]